MNKVWTFLESKLKLIPKNILLLDSFYSLIDRLKFKHIYLLGLFFVIGIILNQISQDKIDLFIIKEVLMISTLYIGIYSIKRFYLTINRLELYASGDIVLSVAVEKLRRRTISNINLLIAIIAGAFYIWISLEMKFVSLNPIGYFALVTLFFSVVISALLLINYFYLILFLSNISKKKLTRIHPQLISKNEWLIEANTIAIYTRNVFFILVSFMVTVFVLFTPTSLWTAFVNGDVNNEGNIPGFLYIISVIIYDFIILPTISYNQYLNTKRIVKNITEFNTQKYLDMMQNSTIDENYKFLNSINLINSMGQDFINSSKRKFTPIATYVFNIITLSTAFLINTSKLFNTFFSSLHH